MATFDASEITDLAEILSTNSDVLGDHLDYFESVITDTDKTRVLELVTEWQAISTREMVLSVEPKERNFGMRIGAGSTASSIVQRIAALLQFPLSSGPGNHSLIRA